MTKLLLILFVLVSWNASARSLGACELAVSDRVCSMDWSNEKLAKRVVSYYAEDIESPRHMLTRDLRAYLRGLDISSHEQKRAGAPRVYSLTKSLLRLNKDSHIVDLGAGVFAFLYEYLIRSAQDPDGVFYYAENLLKDIKPHFQKGRSNVTGVTAIDVGRVLKDDGALIEKTLRNDPKANLIDKRYFEEILLEEIIGKFGQADLVLDYYGVLSYSLNLPLTIEKLARVMKPGSELWLMDSAHDTILLKDGTDVTVAQFLVKTGLFEEVGADLPHDEEEPARLLRRTKKEAFRPKMKLTDLYATGGLPFRKFETQE